MIFQTDLALEIIETRGKPIKKNPFISFKIKDKTLATHRKAWYMVLYLAYVNTNDDENPNDRWGSKWQTEMEFYLKSKGSSIKPDVLHNVVVSFLFEDTSLISFFSYDTYKTKIHSKKNTTALSVIL